jgi:hypothetical protein
MFIKGFSNSNSFYVISRLQLQIIDFISLTKEIL